MTFLFQLLKLRDLAFELRAVGNDLFCFLLQCLPERRIFLLREHTAADRAACTRLKPLQKRGVLLITLSKRLHLCRILCQRPCVFWLVNLGRPSAQLCMKLLQLRVQFCGIWRFRRFTGKLLILLAGLHKLLLQILQIDVFKPPCLQRRDLPLQGLYLRIQFNGQLFAALPLLLRQIQLAAQVDYVLLQLPNFFTPVFEKRFRRRKLHTGEPLLRLLVELRQHISLRNGRQIPLQQLLSILAEFFDEVQGIENGEKHVPFAKHLIEICLPDGIAVVGDAHAILLSAAGQLVCFAGFICKAHCDLQVRICLIVQTVNAALPEKGKSCDGKRDRVR